MISFIVSFLLNFFLWLSIFVGVRLNVGFYANETQVRLTNVSLLINGILLLLYLVVFFTQKRWKWWYPFRLNGLYIAFGCWLMLSVENMDDFFHIVHYTVLFIEIMLINEMFTRDFRKKPAFCGFCAVMLLLWAIIGFQWTFSNYIQYGLAIKSTYGLFIILFIVTYYRELWAKPFYRVLFVNAIVLALLFVHRFSLSCFGQLKRLSIAFRISVYIMMLIVIMCLLKRKRIVLIGIFTILIMICFLPKGYVRFLHGDRNKEWSRNFSICKKDWKSVVFGQRVALLRPWHNAWLDVWMRMGLVGVILWGAGFVYIYWLVLKNWRHFHLCVFVLVMWLTVSIAANCFMGYVSNFVQIYAIMYFLEYFYREKLYARFEKHARRGEM